MAEQGGWKAASSPGRGEAVGEHGDARRREGWSSAAATRDSIACRSTGIGRGLGGVQPVARGGRRSNGPISSLGFSAVRAMTDRARAWRLASAISRSAVATRLSQSARWPSHYRRPEPAPSRRPAAARAGCTSVRPAPCHDQRRHQQSAAASATTGSGAASLPLQHALPGSLSGGNISVCGLRRRERSSHQMTGSASKKAQQDGGGSRS